MSQILVRGSFADLRSRDIRFLEEAAKLGSLHVLLSGDAAVEAATGKAPKFPQAERRYLLEAIRFVDEVTIVENQPPDSVLATEIADGTILVADSRRATAAEKAFATANQLEFRVLDESSLAGLPRQEMVSNLGQPKVVVTGCYDWFHSGHVRFFEEVSELGELHVVVGHDKNVRLLKGEGHPLFPEEERRYMVGAIRFVAQAYISSGEGWLDAEPEFAHIKPDIYAVNEDGDRPEKRNFCESKGIEYRVLTRRPKPGLPKRQSTDLRGF